MIHTITNRVLFCLLGLVFLVSCQSEDIQDVTPIEPENNKIHFNMILNESSDSSGKRIAISDDGNYTTTWEDGDRIGLYIVKGNGSLQSRGNWVDNMYMELHDGKWMYFFPPGKDSFPLDGEKLSFYAYYPYQSNVNDALRIELEASDNQDSMDNFSRAHVLRATNLNVSQSPRAIDLSFANLFSMIELQVTNGQVGATMSGGVQVLLNGCVSTGYVDLGNGQTSLSGVSKPIVMQRLEKYGDANYESRFTYRALVPSQQIRQGSELFVFSQSYGEIKRTLSHKTTSLLDLKPGVLQPYHISLTSPSKDHVYKVGDYYPYKGFPIQGIVFQVSNQGKNGKIFNLNHAKSLNWGNPNVDEQQQGVAGIRDLDDGEKATRNLIAKRKGQGDFNNNYGVFRWVNENLNAGSSKGIWYVPAQNEAMELVKVFLENPDELNQKIDDVQGDNITSQGHLLTSSEFDKKSAYLVSNATGQPHIDENISLKDAKNYWVRLIAIAKF